VAKFILDKILLAGGSTVLLARVSKVYKGLPPKAASVAVKATVGSMVCYAVEAWWPGLERERLGRRSRTGGKGLAAAAN